eukprot:m.159393 g.159393  ORF g.159393 m.159393 type:complete len:145 (+) comp18004_c0_seq1:1658-2092(+)
MRAAAANNSFHNAWCPVREGGLHHLCSCRRRWIRDCQEPIEKILLNRRHITRLNKQTCKSCVVCVVAMVTQQNTALPQLSTKENVQHFNAYHHSTVHDEVLSGAGLPARTKFSIQNTDYYIVAHHQMMVQLLAVSLEGVYQVRS